MAGSIEQALADYREDPGSLERFEAAEAAMIDAGDWRALIRFFGDAAAEVADDVANPWRRLVEALEGIGNDTAEIQERSRLLVATADVWDERLDRPDQAILVYQAAFKVWPQNGEALARARAIYRREGVWKMVAKLYDLQLKVTADPAARAELLCDVAQLRAEHLDDPEGARAMWRSALDCVRDHPRAIVGLRDLDHRRDAGDLDALLAAAESAEGPAAVRALVAVARHLLDEPDDDHDAAAYLHAALAQAPDDAEARRLYRRVLRESGRDDELAETLADHAADVASPAERAELLVERAEVLGRLERPGDAADALAAALVAAPDHARALSSAAAIFGAAGRHSDAIAALERSLDFGGTAHLRMDRARVAGELAWWTLGDLDRAAPFFQRVRLIDATNGTMLRFFVAWWESKDDVEHLATAMQDLAAVVDDEQAAELRVRIARLVDERLDDPTRAADAWAEVVRARPDFDEAHDALRRCLFAAEAWNRLVDQLKHDIARAGADPIPDRVALQLELADLYATRLEVPALAVKAWTDALALDPTHDETLQRLAAHYGRVGRWRDHVDVVLRRVDAIEDEGEKVELLEHVATVCRDELEDAEGASKALARIVELRPDDTAHRAELGELHAARHDFAALARLRLDEAADLEGDAQIDHLRAAVEALAEAEPADRRELLEVLVGITDARDVDAVEALAEVYEDLDEADAHIALLERAIDAADALTPERGMEVAALCEQAGRAEEALMWWQRVLDEHPDHAGARARVLADAFGREDVEALVALAGHTKAYAEVVEALSAIGDADSDASVAALRAGARLAADHLDVDVERDLRARIGDRDAADVSNLERRIELAEDLHERAALLEAAIEAAGPLEASASIDALVALCVDQLEQPARAWMHAAARFEAAPTHTHLDAVEALTDAAGQGDAWLAALVGVEPAEIAEPSDRRAIDRVIVRRALAGDETLALAADAASRLLGDDETDPDVRAEAIAARIDIATRRRDVDALVDAWDLRIADADADAVDGLIADRDAAREALLRAGDEPAQLVDWLVERAAGEDGATRVATWLEAAAIHADLDDGADEAAALYQAVLGEDPANDDALEALEALLRAADDATGLAGLFERQAAAWDDDRGRDALVALAAVHRDDLDDPAASADALWRAAERGADIAVVRAGYEALYAGALDDDLRADLRDRLEVLVREADDDARLDELLTERLADAEGDGLRALHDELAALATARGDDDAALAHRRAIVGAGHVDDVAVDALVAAAASAGDWMSAIGALEAAAEATDGATRAGLLDRVATLQADALDDVDEALDLKMRAARASADPDARRDRLVAVGAWLDDLDEAPAPGPLASARIAIVGATDGDTGAVEAAVDAARAADELGRLAATLETVLDRLDDAAEAAGHLRRTLADLYLDDLDDADEGEVWLRAVLEASPDDEAAWMRLDALLIDAERWDDLVDVLETRAAAAEGADALALLHRLASVHDGARDDADAAAAVWARVVDRDPSDYDARAAWRAALDRAGDADGLEARLVADREVDADARVELDARRVELLAGPLDRRPEAVALARELVDEGHGEAVASVLDVLTRDADPAIADPAREARRDLVAASGDPLAMARTLMTDAEQCDDADREAELLARAAAAIADATGADARGARFELALRWLAVRPAEPAALASLLDATTTPDQWASALDAIDVAVGATEDEAARVELLRAAARIRQDETGEVDAAADTWRMVLALAPGDADAFEALERLLEKGHRYDELALLLVDQGEAAEDDARAVELLSRAARVHELRTRDPDAAVFALDAAIARGGGADLRRERVRLLRRQSRWGDLSDAMADDATLLDGDDAVAAWVQVGTLRRDRLDDLDGAVAAWREALAIDPSAAAAQGALGRLVREASRSDASPGTAAAAAARALLDGEVDESLADAAWSVLVAAGEDDAPLALALHRVAANAPPTRVAEAWWAALPGALADADARATCRDWAVEHHQLDAWREATRDAALAATEPSVATAALLELAEVAAGMDDAPDGAIEALRLAHRIAPDDVAARDALEAALADAGRSDDLADLLEERLADATDDAREALQTRLIDAALAADDPHRALAVLEQAIEATGPTRARLERLETVARDAGDLDRLVAALRGQVEFADTADARRDARMALASVLRDDLDDLDEAAAVVAAATDDAPGDVAVLHALVDLHRRRGHARDLVDALDAVAAAIDDPTVRADTDAEIAAVLLDDLDAPGEALPRLVAVVAHDSAHDQAAARLVELAAHPDLADDVLADADPVLRAAERWHDVIELWRIAGGHDLDPDTLRDLATLAADHAADPDQALAWRARALVEDPRADEIDALTALGEVTGAMPRVVEAFGAAATEAADDAVAVALLRAAARIERDVLDDPGAAAAWTRRIVERDPADLDAVRALAEHHETAGAWDDLVATLDRLADLVPNAERGGVRMRMATVLAGPADRPFDALETLRDHFDDDTVRDDAIGAAMALLGDERVADEAADVLEPVLREPGREEALATVLAARLDDATDDDAPAIADELADLYAGPLDDPDLALTFAARALAADPNAPQRIARMRGLAGDDAGRQARALAAIGDVVDTLDDPDQRLLARRLAVELADGLGDTETVDLHQRVVVADDPRDHEAWEAVRSRLSEAGRADEEFAWIAARAEAVDDPAEAAALWRVAADLASGPLGEPGRAIAALEAAVEAAPAVDLYEELEMLERQLGDVDAAAAWIERRADHPGADPSVRATALRDLARLLTVEAEDPDRAITAWEQVLAEADDGTAADALRGLYADADRYDDLLALLQRELDTGDAEDAAPLLHRIAEVATEHLDDPGTAIEAWRRLLDADPGDARAWAGLAPALADDARWREYVERGLAHAATLDADARATLALDLAEHALGDLDDAALAEQALGDAPEGHGRADVLRARVRRARGDLDGARAALEAAIGELTDPPARADAFVALAELAADGAGDPEAVTSYLEAALAEVPDHRRAIERLDAAYTEARNAWGVMALIDRRLAAASDGQVVDLLLRRADVATDWMDDPDEAAESLARAWAHDDTRIDVGTRLVDAWLAAERTADAARVLDGLIRTAEDASARDVLPTVYEQRARLAEARGDARAALADYERVFAIDARRVPTLVAMGRLRHAAGDVDGALKALQNAHMNHATVKDPALKRDVFYELGRVREALGETDRARDMYRRARSTDRSFEPAQQALDRLKR